MKCVDFTAMMPVDCLGDCFLRQLDLGEGPCPVLVAEGILVAISREAPPWTDGIATLMRNLARRGALAA